MCLETGTSDPEDVRICLLSSGKDIIDLDFFQFTLTDSLGEESTIPIIVSGISINPAALFEISEDGQSAVIIISNDLFDPGKFLSLLEFFSLTAFSLSLPHSLSLSLSDLSSTVTGFGMVEFEDREESFTIGKKKRLLY